MSPKSTALQLLIASLTAGATITVGFGTGAAHADSCPTYRIVGVPGTNQGLAHHPGARASDRTASMGEQTADAVIALRSTIEDRDGAATIEESAVSYAATGIDDFNWWDARFRYAESLYKTSKDSGYDITYQLLKKQAATCTSSKFYLVGFSQGAHIVGDLVQGISKQDAPIGHAKLAGAVVIADPAFNSTDPQAVTFHRRALKMTNFHGALGDRGHYGSNVNVVSVCVDVDPVCVDSIDNAVLNRSDHNTAYLEAVNIDSGEDTSVAGWAGAKVATS